MTEFRPRIAPSLMIGPSHLRPIASIPTAIGSGTLSYSYGTMPVMMKPTSTYIEQCADGERPQNADWHVPLRIPCLLCRRGYGIKPDICKKDHGRTAQDATPSE